MALKHYLTYQKQLLANRYHNRIGQGYVGKDLGVWRRLEKMGRVSRGTGSYGVPEVFTHMLDDTRLVIGNWSSVASTIMLGGGHPVSRVTTYPLRILLGIDGAGQDGFPASSEDTVIGSDVYGGHSSTIMSGVTIGDGAVLGAGALVTKDVPAYAIVGGNPAKVIRYRFDEVQIAALLEICWWDWPEEEILEATPLLAAEDVDAFIEWARSNPHGKGPLVVGSLDPSGPSTSTAQLTTRPLRVNPSHP